jgi:four helix bundle protein
MSRDHTQLQVFADAHQLALDVYRCTTNFPKDEWLGMRAQLRRAAVSVPSKIVEGSARRTTPDYLHFLHVALGSARELKYLAALSTELELINRVAATGLLNRCDAVVRQLERLVEGMEDALAAEREHRTREPKTADPRPEA